MEMDWRIGWVLVLALVGYLIWDHFRTKKQREFLDTCMDVLIVEMEKVLEQEQESPLNPEQKKAVEGRIRELITQNPKLMLAKAKYLMENPGAKGWL